MGDTPQCPFGHGEMKLEKTWKMKGRHAEVSIIIELWRCQKCGKTVRRAA